jgi:hypothetical protein
MTPTEDAASAELTELEARVLSRLLGRVRDFRLIARRSGLVLRGHSRTYYGKQLAQQVVMATTTLPIVANEIEVV